MADWVKLSRRNGLLQRNWIKSEKVNNIKMRIRIGAALKGCCPRLEN